MVNLVIGLTGGIGSGKSTVCELFKSWGTPIINADAIAKQLTEINSPVYHQLKNHLGESFFDATGLLNRAKLRQHIFQHLEEKKWLENLLHPIIKQQIEEKITSLTTPYCVIEIPLLIESNALDSYRQFIDRFLIIDAPQDQQITRATKRDQTTKEQIQNIITQQASREARCKAADDIIDNSGSLSELEKKTKILHQKYLKIAKKDVLS